MTDNSDRELAERVRDIVLETGRRVLVVIIPEGVPDHAVVTLKRLVDDRLERLAAERPDPEAIDPLEWRG